LFDACLHLKDLWWWHRLIKIRNTNFFNVMQRGLLMLRLALRDATLQGSIRMYQLLRWIHFLHLLFELWISQACIRKEFHTTLSTEINRYLSSLSFTIQIHRKCDTHSVPLWLCFRLKISMSSSICYLHCVAFFCFSNQHMLVS
jgi:hypothetical protein